MPRRPRPMATCRFCLVLLWVFTCFSACDEDLPKPAVDVTPPQDVIETATPDALDLDAPEALPPEDLSPDATETAEIEDQAPDGTVDLVEVAPDLLLDAVEEIAPDVIVIEGELRVEVLDVGQGDAILLRTSDGKVALVDGGRSADRVMPHLSSRGITHLHLVLASHADADHIGGLVEVVRTLSIGLFVDNGVPHTTQTYENLMGSVEQRQIPYHTARTGDRFNLGAHVTLDVLWPGDRIYSDQNANSVVLRVTHGRRCFLLTGDATTSVENALVDANLSPCEVLKVAHHGAEGATSHSFLESVRPRLAAVSVGTNSYGHPASTVLNRLAVHNVLTLRTDQVGTITYTSKADGSLCHASSSNPQERCLLN